MRSGRRVVSYGGRSELVVEDLRDLGTGVFEFVDESRDREAGEHREVEAVVQVVEHLPEEVADEDCVGEAGPVGVRGASSEAGPGDDRGVGVAGVRVADDLGGGVGRGPVAVGDGAGPGSAVAGDVEAPGVLAYGHCSPWAHTDGYHWIRDRYVEFDDPLPAKGKQGLWVPPASAIALLARTIGVDR